MQLWIPLTACLGDTDTPHGFLFLLMRSTCMIPIRSLHVITVTNVRRWVSMQESSMIGRPISTHKVDK